MKEGVGFEKENGRKSRIFMRRNGRIRTKGKVGSRGGGGGGWFTVQGGIKGMAGGVGGSSLPLSTFLQDT